MSRGLGDVYQRQVEECFGVLAPDAQLPRDVDDSKRSAVLLREREKTLLRDRSFELHGAASEPAALPKAQPTRRDTASCDDGRNRESGGRAGRRRDDSSDEQASTKRSDASNEQSRRPAARHARFRPKASKCSFHVEQ